MATVYIIAGCNGAGKTTASFTLLPEMLNCKEFVNADGIAAGISPFQPDKVAFEAGRLMLHRIDQLIASSADFAFETTLSTKSYRQKISICKKKGYKVVLIYFWLNSPELAIERIKERVKKGGHYIPDNIVRRRYERGLKNLFNKFMDLCDYWMIMDNSLAKPKLVVEGNQKRVNLVSDQVIWDKIKFSANEK